MKTRVIGLGAGGHAKSVIDALLLGDAYTIVGVLDPRDHLHGSEILGIPVLGADEKLPQLKNCPGLPT